MIKKYGGGLTLKHRIRTMSDGSRMKMRVKKEYRDGLQAGLLQVVESHRSEMLTKAASVRANLLQAEAKAQAKADKAQARIEENAAAKERTRVRRVERNDKRLREEVSKKVSKKVKAQVKALETLDKENKAIKTQLAQAQKVQLANLKAANNAKTVIKEAVTAAATLPMTAENVPLVMVKEVVNMLADAQNKLHKNKDAAMTKAREDAAKIQSGQADKLIDALSTKLNAAEPAGLPVPGPVHAHNMMGGAAHGHNMMGGAVHPHFFPPQGQWQPGYGQHGYGQHGYAHNPAHPPPYAHSPTHHVGPFTPAYAHSPAHHLGPPTPAYAQSPAHHVGPPTPAYGQGSHFAAAAPAPASGAGATTPSSFCQACGCKQTVNAAFCGSCGNKL